jgi:hypothetical protein
MAITVKELREWLDAIPQDALIGVDDGGLTLQVADDANAYIEVGGLPESSEGNLCPGCESKPADKDRLDRLCSECADLKYEGDPHGD